jgi:CRP/FNR family transcriptional regulator, nitrogen oxide reductase regulator
MSLDRSLIAGIPLFAEMAEAQLDDLLSRARSQRFARNVAVFEQGAPAASFYLLLHGRVRAYKISPAGEQIVIRFVGPGEIFGVAMAIGVDAYPANAVAVVDSVALVWPTSAWPDLLGRNPSLAVKTMQTLGERLQETQTRLSELSTQEVERRVAHALLRLAAQGGRKGEDGITFDFPISRQDIAQMTGTTLYTVSRIFSAWEQAGIVTTGRQKVSICAPHRLMLLAEGSGV